MDAIRKIASSYNHADALVTIAIAALIVLAFRQATVDLAGFGEGIAGILTGRGLHAAGKGWGDSQGQS